MNRIRSIFFIVPLLILGAGCPKPAPQVLPEKLPEVTMQEFTGPSEGWPPQPKGRTNVKIVSSTPIAGSLTAAFEGQIRQAALQDARVRNLLGDRFAHISTDEIEPIKDQPRVSADLPSTRVTFFSHANNVAVETYMQGTKVINVNRLIS